MKRRFFASTIEELRRLDGHIDAKRMALLNYENGQARAWPIGNDAESVGRLRSEISGYERFKSAYIQKYGVWPGEMT